MSVMYLLTPLGLLLVITAGITSGLQIDILRRSIAPQEPPPALVYHGEDDCVWEIKIEGNGFPAPNTADGHRLPLLNSFNTGINVKCAVNGTELFDAIIVARDTIPAPENVTVDTGSRILHWNPILQPPSDLPPDFELVHDYNITYLVHMYDKDDVDTAISVNVPVDSKNLNLDDESIEINSCNEQEFVVQAVVNNSHSDNSSAVSGNFTDVPAFTSFSARLQLLIVENVFAIQVTFEQQCVGMNLSVFNVILHGLGSFTFDVNNTHIENGAANFTLPMSGSYPMMDVCTLRGMVYGGNDVGNSEPALILLPDVCPSVTPTSSSTTAATTRPPPVVSSPTSTSPTDTTDPPASGFSSTIIVAVVGVLVVAIIMAIIASIAVMIIIAIRKRRAVACKPQLIEYQNVTLEKGATLAEKPKIDINVNSNYVEVRPLSVPNKMPAMDISTTIYATVDHKKTEELQQKFVAETASPEPERSQPVEVSLDPSDIGLSRQLHLELLLAVLAPVKAKWYALGTHMNLSDNFLDETGTNIETDEECLSDIMKNWLGYHNPSMEVLNYALSQIDEQPIAFDRTLKEFVVVTEGEGETERDGERAVEGDTPPELPERSS